MYLTINKCHVNCQSRKNVVLFYSTLPNMLQSKWMPRPLKTFAYSFTLICAKSSYVFCRLALLTGAFKNTLI